MNSLSFSFSNLGTVKLVISLLIICISSAAEPNVGCPKQCGNVSIPYPFGIGDGCSLDDPNFVITCDSTLNPPKPYLSNRSFEVLDVFLDGQLRVVPSISYPCYTNSSSINDLAHSMEISKFHISNTRNKLTAIGCDTWTGLRSRDQQGSYFTGCASYCTKISDVSNEFCTGIGCCQTTIDRSGIRSYEIVMGSLVNPTGLPSFNACSYAFLVENGAYRFSSSDLGNFGVRKKLPIILDWTIGNQSCSEAEQDPETYACKDRNSICIDSKNGPGYLCNCTRGFKGNPYLSNGCQDIDECEISKPCAVGICENFPGGYFCRCPDGFEGDLSKNGTGCFRIPIVDPRSRAVNVGLVIASTFGLLCLLVGVWWLYKVLKRRKARKLKEKFFKRNGGLLLLKKSSNESGVEKTKLFPYKELEAATHNFNETTILGRGGQGLVYKGMLDDGKIVAVKKSKMVDEGLLEQFINEIVILSQIDHRNVVKLLGCCLETEVPLLVYEFVPNGTLFRLIHDPSEDYPRSWEIRLRIATEVASAISYLHSAASVPIYHRDIKSSNILLDEKLRAKVSDFGTSKSVDIDQTHLTTQVKGTFGYIDPEYFRSSQFTEKSDVYSFGVVLIELLTGRKAVSTFGSNESKSLVANFISCLEENHLVDILDIQVVKECGNEELIEIAYLAKRCLSLDGRNRPTMKEVAMELEKIRMRSLCNNTIHVDQQKLEVDESAKTTYDQYYSDFTSTSTRSLWESDGNYTNSLP